MEKERLFNIIKTKNEDNTIMTDLTINEAHEIFNGHFPGNPVMPGACMLQLVQDILKRFELPYRLKKADYLKFMAMVTPGGQNNLQLKLTHKPADGVGIAVAASLVNNNAVCFKFQGVFVEE